jgi:cyclopropane fatty-acyl-phospholipid synthase-like methyltransferase
MPKPYSPASERNRDPILDVLKPHFSDRRRVLEIGSGTGQHAVHFAAAMPHLRWQCSDRAAYLPGIRQWLGEEDLPNTPEPLVLDANDDWSLLNQRFDAVFSANTLHIMSWPEVERLFAQLPLVLEGNAKLAIYGPFNYGGQFTSASNAAFDATLKTDQAHRGIRDFEAVNAQAEALGFQLVQDYSMPANNRCLLWQRI